MTAEEYLKSNKFQKPGYAGYYVALYDAREAVKMARREERERALTAYQKMLSICPKCTKACSPKCGTDCLIGKFKELLKIKI